MRSLTSGRSLINELLTVELCFIARIQTSFTTLWFARQMDRSAEAVREDCTGANWHQAGRSAL